VRDIQDHGNGQKGNRNQQETKRHLDFQYLHGTGDCWLSLTVANGRFDGQVAPGLSRHQDLCRIHFANMPSGGEAPAGGTSNQYSPAGEKVKIITM
jgi:hypothetical protein